MSSMLKAFVKHLLDTSTRGVKIEMAIANLDFNDSGMTNGMTLKINPL